jgi:3-hydroxyacyl-[acyl-carrier protein] dehydratase/trans-2-decenoyl-[acyl-carrier protein] isomerase
LGVDAIWQLLGFYLGGSGAVGAGRALGCKEVEFFGQIRPLNKLIRYEVEIRRFQMNPENQTAVVIGTGKIFVDDEHIYTIRDAKVGTFLGLGYPNYPFENKNGFGGSSQ